MIVYKPMLAKLSFKVFDDKDWVYERKIDGYRIIAYTGENGRLMSRNSKDYTHKFNPIIKEIAQIKEEAVLDGEIVAEKNAGQEKFEFIQNQQNREEAIQLKYYVFDLLNLKGHDLTQLPLIQRKELLFKLLRNYSFKKVIYHPHIFEKGIELFKQAKKFKWEGILAKKANDYYYPGKRTNSWLKFKITSTQSAIICGYTYPENTRKYFGALVLGICDINNNLKYIGNCGTGFNEKALKEIYEMLKLIKTEKKPFKEDIVRQEKNVTWVMPKYVCEVSYSEWTKDEHLRHPAFKGLRFDKEIYEVTKEEGGLENETNDNRR